MTQQLNLFDPETLPSHCQPRARATDDDTSHEAATRHTTSGKAQVHRSAVICAVTDFPGKTAAELGVYTALGHIETQRRLSDLLHDRMVEKGPARRCTVNGTNMRTWRRTKR